MHAVRQEGRDRPQLRMLTGRARQGAVVHTVRWSECTMYAPNVYRNVECTPRDRPFVIVVATRACPRKVAILVLPCVPN